MPRRLPLLALLAAAAALGISALSSAGGGKYPLDRAVTYRPGHLTAAPGGAAAALIRGAHLRYYRTRIFPIAANGRDDSFMKCPRGKAISGYFASDGGIVEDNSYPGPALKRWNFGLIDLTGAQGTAYTGIVCLEGIGD